MTKFAHYVNLAARPRECAAPAWGPQAGASLNGTRGRAALSGAGRAAGPRGGSRGNAAP